MTVDSFWNGILFWKGMHWLGQWNQYLISMRKLVITRAKNALEKDKERLSAINQQLKAKHNTI